MKLACGITILEIPLVSTSTEARKRWEQWIAALKSGVYKQATKHLRTEKGFCCLGLACEISGEGEWVLKPSPAEYSYRVGSGEGPYQVQKKNSLPIQIQELLQVPSTYGIHVFVKSESDGERSLADLNDGGATFNEIAQILEHAMNGGYTA